MQVSTKLPQDAYIVWKGFSTWKCVGIGFEDWESSPHGDGDSVQDAIIDYLRTVYAKACSYTEN